MREPGAITVREIHLPDTTLRVAECGEGTPLIMVPATVSLIDDWAPLIRFMSLSYRTYFFEMPGHGGSTALEGGFSSTKLARVIRDLANHLGHERFALMGFSFGGILMLRALQELGDRVTAVKLLSPAVGKGAVRQSRVARTLVLGLLWTLSHAYARRLLARLIGNGAVTRPLAWFMHSVGGFEVSTDLSARLKGYGEPTIRVLVEQFTEVLTADESEFAGPYSQPCFFGMSAFDPLLDYAVTEAFVRANFSDLVVETFDFPYHAPPHPLALEDYMRDYQGLLDADRQRLVGSGKN